MSLLSPSIFVVVVIVTALHAATWHQSSADLPQIKKLGPKQQHRLLQYLLSRPPPEDGSEPRVVSEMRQALEASFYRYWRAQMSRMTKELSSLDKYSPNDQEKVLMEWRTLFPTFKRL